jgi:putative membrane protein
MLKLLLGWVASAVALIVVTKVIPDFHVTNFFPGAFIATLVIGLINATLGSVVKFFTFPFRILTLGLLSLVINAVMLKVADIVLDDLRIDTWMAAFLGSIVLSVVSTVLRWMIPDGKDKE